MKKIILWIRNRYHPLFHLRKFALFQTATKYLDIPFAIKIPSINHPVYVSLSKNLSLILSGGTAGEEDERNNFIKIIRLGNFRTFFDVGANIGLYGFLFRSLVPEGRIAMFEPDRDNFKLISKTWKKTKLENVDLIEAAVSDRAGSMYFYKDEISGATGALKNHENQQLFVTQHHKLIPQEIRVTTIRLDDYATSHGDPDFIKIDVEGAESSVFKGAEAVIERAQPAIFFECNNASSPLYSFLTKKQYQLFDFVSLKRIYKLSFNTLALHRIRHKKILDHLQPYNDNSLPTKKTETMAG